jgi:SAM-dependent methyltransferase
MSVYRVESACRSCGSAALEPVLEFGATPLADRLVTEATRSLPEFEVPLTLAFCPSCSLVQILETVEPDILFGRDYPYYSSVSPSLLEHFGASARAIIERQKLDRSSLVVEAASNDGYMLKVFAAAGIAVLGIDPAEGPATTAITRGVPTRQAFFGSRLARELRAEHPHGADVFLANNVLAHVADLNGFVEGIGLVLADGGTAVIEVPYLVDLIEHCEFDTIYHQHLCYFSVTALEGLFARDGLHLNEVERTWVHGGSLRLHVQHEAWRHASVDALLAAERSHGVDRIDFVRDFGRRVRHLVDDLTDLVGELKRSGRSIAGYGAAAKATTLLSFAGIGRGELDFIADKNTHKHGLYMGGNHIPIVAPEQLRTGRPDYLLLLAWNFADEIMAQQAEYAQAGGRFIVPVPQPRIV